MPYIKKIVMNNFKSFAREIEIPFINSMNVVVGPNGSGKSNIADAICFVLGRLGVKSMRASKSSNLIFVGSKHVKPASEASVKMIFDNSDEGLVFPEKEVSVERVVRKNGQSVYKINNETKTRQEVLELLSQAGIDPYGFNIILQGGIQNIVRMHADERRKIIEEVAGISVYEVRKEKSIKELDKTEEKLKEVQAILRERGSYLKNLEQERKQALKYKELQNSVQKYKASILSKKLGDKRKELTKINEILEKCRAKKDKEKEKSEKMQKEIVILNKEIVEINDSIYQSGGIEQETLHSDIAELKAELTGLQVRKENNDQKLADLLNRRSRMSNELKDLEKELSSLREKSPAMAAKYKELEQKRKNLDKIENDKKGLYKLKSELEVSKIRFQDKKQSLQSKKVETQAILREIDIISKNLEHHTLDAASHALEKLKKQYQDLQMLQETNSEKILVLEKQNSVFESEIKNAHGIKKQITEFDICPLCKSEMTKEHVKEVFEDCDKKISGFNKKILDSKKDVEKLANSVEESKQKLVDLREKISKTESNIFNLNTAEKRKERLKQLHAEVEQLEKEVKELEDKKTKLEKNFLDSKNIEEKYDLMLQDIKELSSRTEENIDSEIEFKSRDLERTRIILKQSQRDEEELNSELKDLEESIEVKEKSLKEKEALEKKLIEKFENLIKKRNKLQEEINNKNTSIVEVRHEIELSDNEMNNQRIEKARIDAEIENFEFEFQEFKDVEILSGSIESLKEKLDKAQILLVQINNVNLRALEVYDAVKHEYDLVAEKSGQLEKEKEEILKIIQEIDKRKRRTFLRTLEDINKHFSENFMRLLPKGHATLELENHEDPFSGGLDIVIRIAKGKYFDVASLSGGEQTLIALSLLFAIQKHRPYPFYVFDEIDAALDKRNSERLSALIQQNMEKGQYIIVTHNDALISSANVLYGISMQDGISKLISLEV